MRHHNGNHRTRRCRRSGTGTTRAARTTSRPPLRSSAAPCARPSCCSRAAPARLSWPGPACAACRAGSCAPTSRWRSNPASPFSSLRSAQPAFRRTSASTAQSTAQPSGGAMRRGLRMRTDGRRLRERERKRGEGRGGGSAAELRADDRERPAGGHCAELDAVLQPINNSMNR